MKNYLYWGQSDGKMAYCNERPLLVSPVKKLQETLIASDWPWELEKRTYIVHWMSNLIEHVRQIKSLGCAAADLANLADGNIDGYIHSGLKPWDVAAASLLIKKAGGKTTTPKGGQWNIFNPEILATNKILHKQILSLLNK